LARAFAYDSVIKTDLPFIHLPQADVIRAPQITPVMCSYSRQQ
jgi:hypothetical protein